MSLGGVRSLFLNKDASNSKGPNKGRFSKTGESSGNFLSSFRPRVYNYTYLHVVKMMTEQTNNSEQATELELMFIEGDINKDGYLSKEEFN